MIGGLLVSGSVRRKCGRKVKLEDMQTCALLWRLWAHASVVSFGSFGMIFLRRRIARGQIAASSKTIKGNCGLGFVILQGRIVW